MGQRIVRRFGASALLLLIFGLLSGGCASTYTNVAPKPPDQYEKLGHAKGAACWSLGIVSTAYYAIPFGLEGRDARAYQNAVASVPGATALIDVTVHETWTWWIIVTARCATVEGEAIR